jgi:uncharacterized protein (TIGR02646 family)
MIHIRRPTQAPAALDSAAVKTARKTIADIAARTKPLSDEFPSLWGNKEVRRALCTMQSKKCGYCERRRDMTRESDIDHFRPKAEITQSPQHKGYWWLAYEWKNLLFCCRHCNQSYKLNHFPILDEAKRVSSETQPLSDESAYLIDPCSDDDLEDYFIYYVNNGAKKVYILPRPDDPWNRAKADKTIELLQLNRDELLDERATCVKTLSLLAQKMHAALQIRDRQMMDEAAAEIREQTESSQTFAGFRRFYFRNADLENYISTN